jgi:predicted TIM-barrel fold metal-dependent hydrolase
LIVDSHLHVWNADTPATPWKQGWAAFAPRQSFAVGAALDAMEEAEVDRAVLIPTAWDRLGNELVEQAAAAHPDRFAAFPVLDVRKPLAGAALESWGARPEVAGLRVMFPPGVERSWLEDGTADWVWPAAAEHGLVLMVWMPGQLGHLPAILNANPGLKLVVDHLNITMNPTVEETVRATAELCMLARFPNLCAKVSALPCSATDGYPFHSVMPLVRQAVESFGPERVFWGSDFHRLPCTYRQAVTMFTEEMPALSQTEKTLVMGEALQRWLGWDPPEEAKTPSRRGPEPAA